MSRNQKQGKDLKETFNLLLIGDANNIFNRSFTEWMKIKNPYYKISIISTHPLKELYRNEHPYDDLYSVKQISRLVSKIVILRNICRAWNVLKIAMKHKLYPNTILVQFVNNWQAFIGPILKRRCDNYCLAIWGSDFYRSTSKFYLKNNLSQADNIIIVTPQMVRDFKKKFVQFTGKLHLCYFGNGQIEYLKKLKENSVSKKDSNAHFKLSDKKINVAIGHYGTRAHQHVLILKELLSLDTNVAKKIRLILPLNYGLPEGYLEEILNAVIELNIEYKVFTEFLTGDDLAHLRNMVDIMVNLQTTDAFSASMREVFYCGGVVINGSWLPYQFLKEKGIYYEEVDSVQMLPELIQKIVDQFDHYKKRCKENPAKIYELTSWNGLISEWRKVIELKRS